MSITGGHPAASLQASRQTIELIVFLAPRPTRLQLVAFPLTKLRGAFV